MTTSNSHPPLLQLARQLERDSSAYAVRIAGMIITGFGVLSLITLSGLGRNTTIAAALIPAGIVTFTRRITGSGAISYSCETLAEIVRRLHQQAGIEGGNASAARRTFAVRLHRDGRSLKLIQELIACLPLSTSSTAIQCACRRL
ncbi:TPA: hypothetical protein QDC03_007026 [Burkholderia cepacia]|uniref:hypothetical protein n=1 Tax=Burkholderia cepacia TaxID=292 RepID=UPI0015E28160|nr:hypothetical protein [Burkholderia cepacia]HDR9511791.1 hypothetical protein [Burkholderia cepacia]